MIKNNFYWNKFYKKFNLAKPSSFAEFVYKKIKIKKNLLSIIDIGCGNGRDTLFFLKKGFLIVGLDKSRVAIIENKKKNKNFIKLDICKKNILKKKYDIIYCRFFLHSINIKEESIFFDNLKKISKKKTLIYLEFRTDKDPLLKKGKILSANERIYGHYRRFINMNQFKKKVVLKGFKIIKIYLSFKFAYFFKQKPHIARVILKCK